MCEISSTLLIFIKDAVKRKLNYMTFTEGFFSMHAIHFLFFIMFLINCVNSYGQQTSPSDSFIRDFYRETVRDNPDKNNSNFPKAEKIILNNELATLLSDTRLLSVGISDVETDSAAGLKQAYLRSIMLAALLQKTTLKYVTENFNSQDGTPSAGKSNFQEIYKFEADLTETDTFHIIYSCRLPSKETILFVAIPQNICQAGNNADKTDPETFPPAVMQDLKNNNSDGVAVNSMSDQSPQKGTLTHSAIKAKKPVSFKVAGTLYHSEKTVGRSQQVFRTEYQLTTPAIENMKIIDQYSLISMNGKWSSVSTYFNGIKIEKPSTRFFYYMNNPEPLSEDDIKNSLGMTTIEGLWPALITGILWQLTGASLVSKPTVKQVQDKYDQKLIELNRISDENALKFTLSKLKLESNRLYPILDIEINNSEKQ